MTKWLWIVAGPNGSGKSTHTARLIAKFQASNPAESEIIKLNADERTADLKKQCPERSEEELNLQAAQETDAALEKHIVSGTRAILVETVLSSIKYQDDVLEAKARGYKVGLIYVSVHPPEVILDRIQTRVARGGHNVDPQKALDRYKRSHRNFVWFAQHADTLFVFDNSDMEASPVLVAMKEAGKKLVHKVKGFNASIDNAIHSLRKIKPYNPKPLP